MKKILAIIFGFCMMISSAFAVNSAIGVKGFIGTPAGTTVESDIVNYKQIQPTLSAGGGLYLTFGLNDLLGFQVGMNAVTHEVAPIVDGQITATYKSSVLEFPLLGLIEFQFGRFGVSAAVGPSFSVGTSLESLLTGFPEFTNWNIGLYTGLSLKYGLTSHIHTVAGANYVFDFTQSHVSYSASGINISTAPINGMNYTRRSLVANLGLEFQFF